MGNALQKRKSRKKSKEAPNPVPAVDQLEENGDVEGNENRPKSVVDQDPAADLPDYPILRALYDYDAPYTDDLSFKKGEKMYLIGDENCDWWMARHIQRNDEGYIPSNYVQKEDGKPQSHVSWFDLPRRESDKLLLMPGNPPGTYISRISATPGCYALSIRDFSERSQLWRTVHYRIRQLDNGRGYFVSPKRVFPTYDFLIDYYERHGKDHGGLCQKLVLPCPRVYKPPVHFRDMIQPKQAFKFTKKLGHGHFGDVYAGKWNNIIDVAIKTMKAGGSSSKDDFLGEAKVMHQLYHPHILPLLGVCVDDNDIYIVTEIMSKGALLELLRGEEGRKLSLDQMVDMAAQIADGCAFLEGKDMVHRDLRAANILVGDNYLCKIADFGLAQFKDENFVQQQATKFPIKWTAPEAADDKNKFTVKSDVWSFGILLWEMFTLGKTPYPGMDPSSTLIDIRAGYRMPKPTCMYGQLECPEALYDIMMKCWNKDPDSRPRFEYLAKFFDDFATEAAGDYGGSDMSG